MRTYNWLTAVIGMLVVGVAATCFGDGPSFSLLPFKRVEADPKKDYALTDDHGPWMILATSFAGEGAESQAKQLVLELRRDYKLPAYVHKQHYDFTKPVDGIGVDKYGEVRKMKHLHGRDDDEIAVLVGNYASLDDANLQKALQTLKYAQPKCLDLKSKKGKTAQQHGLLRDFYRFASNDQSAKAKGPMGSAFATLNPLLPEDESDQTTLDPLVVQMNKDVKFGLLKNRSKYSVKVATFGGVNTWKKDEIESLERGATGKLEEAAFKANKLTESLRAQGVEAWEFHDLHESIVCIGGFDSVGQPREDGKIEINPAIFQIIKKYGAEQKTIPGQPTLGLQPKSLGGIRFDVQPIPVEVPKVSLAARYSRKVSE